MAEPTRRADPLLIPTDGHNVTAVQEQPTAPQDHSADRHTVIASPAEILASAAVPRAERKAGRYTIVRSHAKGGLGEVFAARDEELGRQVALKEIQARYAHVTECRARFVREAEITGHLEHPGVVPVYGLGSFPDGRPYYAMRFIRGHTLHDAIYAFHEEWKSKPFERLSVSFRKLLSRFVVVCQTMAYAHSRGVIHRDIKPANVMLGDYGEVLVVDWGLAKMNDGPATGEDAAIGDEPTLADFASSAEIDAVSRGSRGTQTMSGAVLGTPAFMSPEQAEGDWPNVGPAADIYSLGATLYVLLTGKPPVNPGAWPDQLEQILRGVFPPPRAVKPELPPALEAVCLKAMAMKPADRYATAAALAADLEHWLADEPVTAYREPWADRARRFARRHRTAFAGATAAVLVGLVSLGVTAVLLGTKNAELVRQRDIADEQRRQTRAALDDMTSLDAVDFLGAQQQLSDGQRKFLQRALAYYERFAEQAGRDPGQRRQAAEAQARVGQLLHRLGDLDRAGPAIDRAVSIYDDLNVETPGDQSRADLARALTLAAKVRRDRNEFDAAETALVRAAELGEQGRAAAELTDIYQQLGLLRWNRGRPAEAEAAYGKARDRGEQWLAARPTDADARRKLAVVWNEIGGLMRERQRLADAETAYRRGLELREKLEVDRPTDTDVRRELAYSYVSFGLLLKSRDNFAGAEASLRKAAERFEKLAAEFPGLSDYRRELAAALREISLIDRVQNRPTEAEAAARRALQLSDELRREQPQSADFRVLWADNAATLARTVARSQPDEAEALYRDAVAALQKLADELKQPAAVLKLAGAYESWAIFQRSQRKWIDAIQSFRRAAEVLNSLKLQLPDDAALAVRLADCRNGLGHVLRAASQPAEAAAAYTEAIAAVARLADQPEAKRARVTAYAGRAAAHNAQKRPTDAAADFGTAAELTPPGPERDELQLGRVLALRLSNDIEHAVAEALDLTADSKASAKICHACAWVVAVGPGRSADAVKLLRRAAAGGYTDLSPAYKSASFTHLRSRADFAALAWAVAEWAEPPRYEYRNDHDPNGTGKFYRGREIAQVMGHQAADWLDRPEREAEEKPSKLLELLKFRPGEVVADIGAGSGYHTLRIAKLVGPAGSVLAVDIQPEMLDLIRERATQQKLANVRPVRGAIDDPKLPAASVDTVLMVDVYHEFSHPHEMMEGILKALKPGGRVVFVEFRAEDDAVPIKAVHKMSERQVVAEMEGFPLKQRVTFRDLPWQHVIVFEKPKDG